jgi:hypothetical protein
MNNDKAMIDVIPKDITLEDAFDLSRQVEFFSVTRVVSTSAEYGSSILSKYSIECEQELFSSTDLYEYGKKLIEEMETMVSIKNLLRLKFSVH